MGQYLVVYLPLQISWEGSLQARLAARAKVKQTRALEICVPFASLDAESISTIVDAMEFAELRSAPLS